MRGVIVLCAVCALGLQCSAPKPRTEERAREPFDSELPTRTVLSSDTLWRGASVVLQLGRPHPQGLAMVDPDDRYFFLQKIGEVQLMDSAAFANLRALRLEADMTGLYYDDGMPVKRVVFTKPGRYTIYLADDLETEFENTNAESLELWFAGSR